MLNKKARRDFANRRLYVIRKTVHGEQELMLLRLDAVVPRGGLAEMQKSADLAAELGEFAILLAAEILAGLHIYIVARYK